jgi:hypothetical protein
MIQTLTFEELARSSKRTLDRVFAPGVGPAVDSLVGFEWRGFNVPWYTKITGQKFIKGFFRSDAGIEGYNIMVARNGLTDPWIERPSPESPKRFRFYVVSPVDPAARDNRYPRALFLNYRASLRNRRFAPERILRSFLVQPYESNPDILIGKAYYAIGNLRWYAAFYILERLRRVDWRPED